MAINKRSAMAEQAIKELIQSNNPFEIETIKNCSTCNVPHPTECLDTQSICPTCKERNRMPNIIQIKGTQCSGKTWAYETIKDSPNVCVFDILDFYNKYDCLTGNQIDWEKWEQCIDLLPAELENLIQTAGNKLIIVEHSANRHVNKVLANYTVETIELEVPDVKTIVKRAKARNLSAERTADFRNLYLRRFAGSDVTTVTTEQARKIFEDRIKPTTATITYLDGSALTPQTKGNAIICHVCNDIGGWGSGFVVAISNTWPEPEKSYRDWHKSKYMFQLGACQLVKVTDNIQVANMIAQTGTISTHPGSTPIRYEELRKCLNKVAHQALKHQATVHMPRIGCGLAGGKWAEVEQIVNNTLIQKNINTYVYTLPGDNSWRD